LHSPYVLELDREDAARGLDGIDSGLARSDPDGFFDVGDKYLAVADAASLGGAPDRFDGLFHQVVAEYDLDFHLG
jgi:hypothetical protein